MKKHLLLISTFLLISFFYACEENILCPQVTIPETDNIPPQYTLSINGPGIGQTISTQDGWLGGQLDLFAGGRYTFVFSASDQGGMRLLRMQIPIDITITDLDPGNATSRDVGPFSKILELTNDDLSPTSCLIMNGKFTASENLDISARISFFASDYGGTSGVRNSTARNVSISFTDDIERVGFSDF